MVQILLYFYSLCLSPFQKEKFLKETEYILFHFFLPIALTAILIEANKFNPRNLNCAVASTTLHLYKCALFYKIF